MNIKIIVATHKPYRMPDDPMYLPVHCGAAGKESIGHQRDDEGDNISVQNDTLSELTGLYWAWKNLKDDYIGLVHYRRLLKSKHTNSVIKYDELSKLLCEYQMILPKKRKFYLINVRDHYSRLYYSDHIYVLRETIAELSPDYLASFDDVMKSTSEHQCNMFIMKNELLDKYCKWAFPIILLTRDKVNYSNYTPFHARFPGRISERLIDVWITKNKIAYSELDYYYPEGSRIVTRAYKMFKSCIGIRSNNSV